jgi:hypothetical protein
LHERLLAEQVLARGERLAHDVGLGFGEHGDVDDLDPVVRQQLVERRVDLLDPCSSATRTARAWSRS